MTATIKTLSADERQEIAVNKRSKESDTMLVGLGQDIAGVFLGLTPGITQTDYPRLKKDIEKVTGIQFASFPESVDTPGDEECVVDGRTESSLGPGKRQRVLMKVAFRIEDIPEEEP